MKFIRVLCVAVITLSVRALSIPDTANISVVEAGQSPSTESEPESERFVFAHFMVGFVNSYTQEDWNRDINLAASKGIDGFALNCDGQETNNQQLQYAFKAATSCSKSFKLFISPDFVHYSISDPQQVSDLLKSFISESAYFNYQGKPFVSSFWGEGIDWIKIEENLGKDLYICPYYYASQSAVETPGLDGLFSWYTWPGQDTDEVVYQNLTTNSDEEYLNLLAPGGKTYMAPVSPWFYSHLPASTGYAKNYHLYSDTLWTTRWQQILDLNIKYSNQLKFIEIITWNDWTESSLISPYRGTLTNDGNKEWSEEFDHSAFMDLMYPFISAFKSGQSKPQINENRLVWWYRPTLKSAECSSTDSVGEKPRGWEMAADSVFVAALTTAPATITVKIGDTTSSQIVDEAGVHTLAFPMSVGSVSFQMDTDGCQSISGNGAIEISDQCYHGVYNFNVLSGTATAGDSTSNPPESDNGTTSSTYTSSMTSSSPISNPATGTGVLSPAELTSSANSAPSKVETTIDTSVTSTANEVTTSYVGSIYSAPTNGWRNGGWRTHSWPS
ncbi:uncharacterized protein I206_107053 [Kwoniella pini CBS 10737]|uniref:Mutanase n=1 Tax=Kwoniella pini CBS 10737 TaxID=1296096 RepID=A0AAJ8MTG9_9TREE